MPSSPVIRRSRPVGGPPVLLLKPLAEIGGKPDQVSVRVLHEELMHPGFGISGAIPFLLRLHEQRPACTGERRQYWLDDRDTDLGN
jgi:hypothetical protein